MAVGHQDSIAEREPTHAEGARALMEAASAGALATVSVDVSGYPFGSVVSYALDAQGRPLLLLSDLAEHTRNLKADARASLMATEGGLSGDSLALGRVTLVGDLGAVPPDALDAVRASYLAVHPDSDYVDFHDFNFYRLDVKSVRYVGGFGQMSWVTAADYSTVEVA